MDKKYIIPAKFYNGRYDKLRQTNKSIWNKLVQEEMYKHLKE